MNIKLGGKYRVRMGGVIEIKNFTQGNIRPFGGCIVRELNSWKSCEENHIRVAFFTIYGSYKFDGESPYDIVEEI